MEPDEARPHVAEVWERARRARPGETARDQAWWDMAFIDQAEKSEDFSPVFRLRHDDGYAAYRVRMLWNEGAPGHELDLIELVAVTDDAHAALWNTLLGVDLVATITSRRAMALDDPLPYLLEDPRSVRTEGLDDCPVAATAPARHAARRPDLRHGGSPGHRGRGRRHRIDIDSVAGRRRGRGRVGRPDPAPTRPGARSGRARRDLPRRRATVGARSGTAPRGDEHGRPASRRPVLRLRSPPPLPEPLLGIGPAGAPTLDLRPALQREGSSRAAAPPGVDSLPDSWVS